MKCPQCGKDDPKATKFCTSCGAPLPAQPTQVQAAPTRVQPVQQAPVQPTTMIPVAPVAPAYAAQPPLKKKMKGSTKAWIAVACIVGACLIAAAIIIPLVIAAGNKPVAQVSSVKLLRTSGDTLDLDKVPLDTEVAVTVNYKARFKDNGSGTLRITVVNSEDKSIVDKTYDVKSSDQVQKQKMEFSMTEGSGKPLTAKAKLDVTQGATKLTDSKALAFTAVVGKGQELQLKEAKAAATEKCREATDLLKAAAGQVTVTDLADRLSKTLTDLEAAKTAAQADAAKGAAQAVIDECNARLAAAKQKQESAATCKANQATIRAKLVDWWSGTGTFPDSMSQLYGIPSCPSGGTYTYYAPDTTPATLEVSCSVHGVL
ncbi:MAG: hypothetical protein ACYC99_11835 [Candidatus Geothermincolia bacterium]